MIFEKQRRLTLILNTPAGRWIQDSAKEILTDQDISYGFLVIMLQKAPWSEKAQIYFPMKDKDLVCMAYMKKSDAWFFGSAELSIIRNTYSTNTIGDLSEEDQELLKYGCIGQMVEQLNVEMVHVGLIMLSNYNEQLQLGMPSLGTMAVFEM